MARKINTEADLGVIPWRHQLGLPPRWLTTIDDDDLPYVVELEFVMEGSTPRCGSMRLVVRPGGAPLKSARTRDIPIGECIEQGIAAASMRVEQRPDGGIAVHPHAGASVEHWRHARRMAEPRSSDEHLQEVARIYQDASEKPTEAVQDAWRPVSYSTAARWVMLARRRGFLPPANRKPKEKK